MIHRFDKFGGIVPKLGIRSKPEGVACESVNIDVGHGTLRTIRKSDISTKVAFPFSETQGLAKPTVTIGSPTYIFQPENDYTWTAGELLDAGYGDKALSKLVIESNVWLLDFTSGGLLEWGLNYQIAKYSATPLDTGDDKAAWWNYSYTETGLTINYFNPIEGGQPYPDNLLPWNLPTGHTVKVLGPKYRFALAPNVKTTTTNGVTSAVTDHYGGPDKKAVMTWFKSFGDTEIPTQAIPLVDQKGNIYAHFQVIDVSGPSFDETYYPEQYSNIYFPPFSAQFTVNMNYSSPKRKWVHYAVSLRDKTTADYIEGPPSEMSEAKMLLPGQSVTVTPDKGSEDGFNTSASWKVYKSATQSVDDFVLVRDNLTEAHFKDIGQPLLGELIPPYGNRQLNALDEDKCVMHPSHFGAMAKDSELWLSDVYRLHAWPKEYVIGFTETIKAVKIVGNTFIVFTAKMVYGISGSSPENMSKSIISSSLDLYNGDTSNICSSVDAIYWVTDDGIASTTGGPAKLVTEELFSPVDWKSFNPSVTYLKYEDNSLWWNGYKWYMGPNGGLTKISSDSLLPGCCWQGGASIDGLWTSHIKSFENPIIPSFVRCYFDIGKDVDELETMTGPGIKVINYDTGESVSFTDVQNGKLYDIRSLGYVKNIQIEITVKYKGIQEVNQPVNTTFELAVGSVELLENQSIPVGSSVISISPETVDSMSSVTFQFPAGGGAPACICASSDADKVLVKIYSGDEFPLTKSVVEWTILPNKNYMLPRLAKATLWMFEITASSSVDGVSTEHTVSSFAWHPWIEKDSPPDVLRIAYGNETFPPWMYTRWQVPGISSIGSFRVVSSDNKYIRFFLDGEAENKDGLGFQITGPLDVNGNAMSVGDDVYPYNGELKVETENWFSKIDFQIYGSKTDSFPAKTANLTSNSNWSCDEIADEIFIYYAVDIPVEGPVVIRGISPTDGWRNKTLVFPSGGTWNSAMVSSRDGLKWFKLDDHKFKIDSGNSIDGLSFDVSATLGHETKKRWSFDLDLSTDSMMEIALFPRIVNPCGNSVIVRKESTPWCWTGMRFQAGHAVEFSCMRVISDDYGTAEEPGIEVTIISISANGALNYNREFVMSDKPIFIKRLGVNKLWKVDITGEKVNNVKEFAMSTSMKGLSGGA